jgi:hypothetical protein
MDGSHPGLEADLKQELKRTKQASPPRSHAPKWADQLRLKRGSPQKSLRAPGNLPRILRASQSCAVELRQALFRERDYLNTRILRTQEKRMTSEIHI